VSHTRRHIIISSRATAAVLASATDDPSPYDITVGYTPADDATPEQVGTECKRIIKKIDQIEHGSDD
jgi:hypothetical protein